MKKFLLFTNIILLGVIFFQTFNKNGQGELYAAMINDTVPRHRVDVRAPETDGILIPGPGRCDFNTNYDDYRLDNLITIHQAKSLADNYYADRGKRYIAYESPTQFGTEDARSAWFSLEKMKAFLSQVEKKSCLRDCKPSSLGIRIYYGKYPEKSGIEGFGVDTIYANHHTLFFIPTYFDGTKHIDFDPRKFKPGRGCRPYSVRELLSDTIQNTHNNNMIFTLDPGGNANNHGGLLPPPPGKGSGFGNN